MVNLPTHRVGRVPPLHHPLDPHRLRCRRARQRARALAGAVLLLLCVLDAKDRDAEEVDIQVCARADRGCDAVGHHSGAVDLELESLYGRFEYGWGLVGEDFWGEEVEGDECYGVDLWAGWVL